MSNDKALDVMEEAVYSRIKKIDYASMYDQLAKMKFQLREDPIEFGLGPVTEMIAKLNEMISDVHQLYLDAIRNKDTWQRAYRSVSDLYDSRLAALCTREDIKGYKTVGERESRAKLELQREEKLLKEVEKHYMTEGNSSGGEAVTYLTAVNSIRELLQVTNSNLKLQLQVVQDMINTQVVTPEELRTRKDASKKLQGK